MNTTHTAPAAKIGLDLITILKVEGPFSWHRFKNTTYTTFKAADDVLLAMASGIDSPSAIYKISFKVVWTDENEYAGTIELRASHADEDEIIGEHMRSFATASIEMDAPWMSNEKKAEMVEEFRALLDHYHLTDVVEDEPASEPKIEVVAKHALTSITILNAEGPVSWKDRFCNITYSTFKAADDAFRTMASEMNTEPSIYFDVSFKAVWADKNSYEGVIELRAVNRDADLIVSEHIQSFASGVIESNAIWSTDDKAALQSFLNNYRLSDDDLIGSIDLGFEDSKTTHAALLDNLSDDEGDEVAAGAPMTYVRQYTLMQRNGIEQEGDEDVEGILLVGTVLASWTTDHCDYGYDTVFVRPAYHDGEQAWLVTYHWNPGHGYTASGDQEVIVDLMPGLQFLVEHEQFQALFGAGVPS